jgi:hypothetical protein
MGALDLSESDTSTTNHEVEGKAGELLRQAELLMEVQGYHQEGVRVDDETIDITASKPDSEETVLMRIVTESTLKSNGVGVEQVEEAKQILEEPEVDRVVMFGKSFTQAARNTLRDDGIAFFSTDQRFISTLAPPELYATILECFDELCQIKCGHVPQSEAECAGYSAESNPCTLCGGRGRTNEDGCPRCAGTGLRATHYSCRIRLLSDNADFHVRQGWKPLLQHDLVSLLKMLRSSKRESNKDLPLSSSHGSSVQATVSVTGR